MIKNLFTKLGLSPQTQSEDALARDFDLIEKSLGGLQPEQAHLLAAFALLLGRVAYADMQVTADEKTQMQKILTAQMNLSAAQAAGVAQVALNRVMTSGVDLMTVVREVKSLTQQDERMVLVRALFRLACENGISAIEGEEIRIITLGLDFSEREYSVFRSEFRDHLTALKGIRKNSKPS